MLVKERNCFIKRGAGCQHAFSRIPLDARLARVGLPFFFPAGHPIVGQAFRVQTALAPTIVETDVRTAITPFAGRNKPDPRHWTRRILVITEEYAVRVREDENRARLRRHRRKPQPSKCQLPFHTQSQ